MIQALIKYKTQCILKMMALLWAASHIEKPMRMDKCFIVHLIFSMQITPVCY
jgi:hypothetical protein